MRALVYTATNTVEPRDVAGPEPSADQCVIDVALCGICGSDMHAYHGHDPRRQPPLVLGHEAVGVVRDGPLAGRRVAVNPLMTCGTCAVCTSGAAHLCPDRELLGMRVPGAFAEAVAVSSANLTALPDALAFEDAVLAEPLACAVHAVRVGLERLARPASELSAAVLGGGAIGLLCASVLRARGVAEVHLAEPNSLRRGIAGEATGARTYDPTAAEGPAPGSVPLVIDAVGSGRTRAAASALAAPGGAIVHVGLQDSGVGLDSRRLTLQEIAFLGVYCYSATDFAGAIQLLSGGEVRAEGWTARHSLAEGAQAFRAIDEGSAPPKILLAP